MMDGQGWGGGGAFLRGGSSAFPQAAELSRFSWDIQRLSVVSRSCCYVLPRQGWCLNHPACSTVCSALWGEPEQQQRV